MDSSVFYLIVNAFLYIFLMCFACKKVGFFSGSALIISFYVFCAIFSILFYTHPYTKGTDYYNKLHFEAFIYFAALTSCLIIPILKFDCGQKNKLQLVKEQYIIWFIKIVLPLQLLLFIYYMPTFFFMLNSDMGEMRDDITSGDVHISDGVPPFVAKLMFYYNIIRNVVVIIAIYSFFAVKNHRFMVKIFTISSLFYPIFLSSLYLMRSQIFVQILYIIFFLLIFRSGLNQGVKRYIYIAGVFLVMFASVVTISISNSRFGDLVSWMYYKYLGETFTNFAGHLWSDLKGTTHGYAYFRWFLQGDDWYNLQEKWQFIENRTNIDGHIFYGAIGQLIIEFGWVLTAAIYVCLSVMFVKLLKNSEIISLPNLLILGLIAQYMIYGAYTFPFQGTAILQIFAYIFFYWLGRKIQSDKVIYMER